MKQVRVALLFGLPLLGLAPGCDDETATTGAPTTSSVGAGGGGGAAGAGGTGGVGACGAAGTARWALGFGDLGAAQRGRPSVDAAGNVYLSGAFDGSLDLGGVPLTAAGPGLDGYIAKLDPMGQHLWSRSLGASQASQPGFGASFAAVDGSGNVYWLASFQGAVDFGDGTPLVSAGDYDVALARLDASGNVAWSWRDGDAAFQRGAVAVNAAGAVAVGGTFKGAFGGFTSTSGTNDVFVGRVNPDNGQWLWLEQFGGADSEVVRSVHVDAMGNTFVGGDFSGALDFGGPPLVGGGGFIAKLGPSGQHVFTKHLQRTVSTGQNPVPWYFASDAAGNVAVSGAFADTVQLDAAMLTSAGDSDQFIVELDASGNVLWTKVLGDAAAQDAGGLALDAAGNVLTALYGGGTIDFGGGQVTTAGADVAIVTYDANGQYLSLLQFGDAMDQWPDGIALDAAGRLIVAGAFGGALDFGLGPLVSAGGLDLFVAQLCR